MIKTTTLALTIIFAFQLATGQTTSRTEAMNSITEEVLAAQLEFLSSDWMQGRETGTEGAYMASDYVASMFKTFGLKPGAKEIIRSRRSIDTVDTYFQNFNLVEYRSGDVQKVSILKTSKGASKELVLTQNADFNLSAGSRAVNVESELVFAGYGLKTDYYNDFEGIDAENKIIIRLKGFPGHSQPDSKAYQKFAPEGAYSAYFLENSKDRSAIEAGVAGIIEIDPAGQEIRSIPGNYPIRYNSPSWEGTEPFRNAPRTRMTRPDNSSATLTKVILAQHIIEQLLADGKIDLKEFETSSSDHIKPASRQLKGLSMKIETTVISRVIQARNVVGILEGRQKDTCIVIGAHFDHMGQVRSFIYNGSDDNASGTVGITTIAKSMIQSGVQPEYTLVFCAWTGEEKGLIGSAYFADHPVIPNIKCYMNYDMISRVALNDPDKNKCDFQFTSTVPLLKEITENHIDEFDINLDMTYKGSPVPRGGSDFTSFSQKGIPIFLLHGKFTPDYHQYTDHADKADLTYMRDIVRLGFLNIYSLATTNW